jgi:hypothetical protein
MDEQLLKDIKDLVKKEIDAIADTLLTDEIAEYMVEKIKEGKERSSNPWMGCNFHVDSLVGAIKTRLEEGTNNGK